MFYVHKNLQCMIEIVYNCGVFSFCSFILVQFSKATEWLLTTVVLAVFTAAYVSLFICIL